MVHTLFSKRIMTSTAVIENLLGRDDSEEAKNLMATDSQLIENTIDTNTVWCFFTNNHAVIYTIMKIHTCTVSHVHILYMHAYIRET
jgi:hypothetical protein